ncbi:E3 ubiquitin-protein ligase TRIM39-like isoform X2 [Cebidichthys violaceus]|uniref:E3 ubiquitin-protein ligase TRIM39-like isoform X2 n=1 Tax=Cebidichthys violaceus TaxID=271503 RepID=UPI0035CB8FAE
MTTQKVANMALAVSVEEQFKCCICLDIFTDPTSIPCGHNFCLDCIEDFWDTKTKYECPLCKETFEKRPQLRINLGYAEIIDIYKRTQRENLDDVVAPGSRKKSLNQLFEADGVPCDICCGDKSPSVKSCLRCLASYCEHHLAPHLRDPALQTHQLTDPNTFITGHFCRKHKKPLTMFCKSDQKPVCVKCTEHREHKHHTIVPIEKERKRVKTSLRDTKASIKQMIHARRSKMEQIKNSVGLSKIITKREIQGSAKVCGLLITTIERHQARLEEELEEKHREAERRAEELLVELEQEIHELQTRGIELKQLEHSQSPIHLLQSFPSLSRLPSTGEWSEVAVYSDNCMGTVTRAFSKLVNICQDLSDKLSADEADKLNQYAVDVTLDPETASGWLVLSPDRKKVTVSSQRNNLLPDNPRRFDSCVCVLGEKSFASGRRYWVVQVGDKTDWDLGVTRESCNRKGSITVRPDSGYWAICRRRSGSLSACAGPTVTLRLQETPQKVGVFLDYEEGSVSFYDAEAKTHIYTYSGCDFNEPINPYFNPCVQNDGKNTAPLIICPLEERVREGQDMTIESAM